MIKVKEFVAGLFGYKRPIYFDFIILSSDTYQIREGGSQYWKDGFKWVKKSEK